MKALLIIIMLALNIPLLFSQLVSLNQQEKDAIFYMREEEKVARDVYDSLNRKWTTLPFSNIRQSEQYHMDRMKNLISNYQLKDPVEATGDKPGRFVNADLQKFYTTVVTSGSESLNEALKAGARIEETDIADLQERINQTTQPDILSTYRYLKMASENHLRAFNRRMQMLGITYEPVLLSKKDYNRIISSAQKQGRGRRMN